MSQGQEMNAERAREKVARFTKGCGSGCGKCVTLNEYHEAKGYLMALEQGPEVRALVSAAEKVIAHYNIVHRSQRSIVIESGGMRLLREMDEALSTFQKAVSNG